MLWLAASLPDALVGVAPDTDGALRLRLDDRPETAWQALVSPGMEQDRVEDRAEDKVQWRGMSSDFCGAGRNATGFVQFDYTPK